MASGTVAIDIITLEGTFGASTGWSNIVNWPSGVTRDTCSLLGFEVYNGSTWRIGAGITSDDSERLFAEKGNYGVRIYTNIADFVNQPFRVHLRLL